MTKKTPSMGKQVEKLNEARVATRLGGGEGRLPKPRGAGKLTARVPGNGVLSAMRLVELRRHKRIRYEDVTRLRCALDKARPFIVTQDYRPPLQESESHSLRRQLSETPAQMALW